MEIRQSNLARTGPLVPSPSAPLSGSSSGAPKLVDPQSQPPVSPEAMPHAAPRLDEAETTPRNLADMLGEGNLDPFVTGNLQAIADLSKLQADGKLKPEVLAGLERLAIQPLAPGIERADLIATALRQLADPGSVGQSDASTYAAAVVQTMVAKEHPAGYLWLVAGLASPEGSVTLRNGASLTRDATWQHDPTRSVIDTLMQPSLMRFAGGSSAPASDSRKTASSSGKARRDSASLPRVFVRPAPASPARHEDDGGFFGGLFKGISKVVQGVGNAFNAIGNAVKKAVYEVVDVVAPVLPILSVAAWLIPGVGPIIGTGLKIAQAVVAGVNAVRAAESGDILGALAAGASAFSGVATGPAAGVAAKFASYANTARSAVSALKSGNVAGALGAIASVTGNQNLATAANVANALQNRDLGAALGAVGAATGNQTFNRAAALANTAQQVKHALDSKDFLGAAMTINGLAVDAKILDAGQGQDVQRWLERGQVFDQARRTGDVGQLVDLAAKTAGELGVVAPKEYRKVAPKLKQGMELYQAAKRGDTDAAIRLGSLALSGTGWFKPKIVATAQGLAEQVQLLRQAIASKDYGSAAKLAARMGYEAGVLGLSDPEALANVEDMAKKAARLNEGLEASRRGESLKAAKVADEVFNQSRLQRELEELTELKEAYEAKLKAAVKSNGQKVK